MKLSNNLTMSKLCCDCASPVQGDSCAYCGSTKILSHPELGTLSIAHVDCDAFFCSVEKRDNPEIRDKPVIVGGGQRGVVSAACYHARIYGVRSAMPMFKALKLCPEAVVVRGNMEKYARDGAIIRDMMQDLTPAVEPLSIDEAFMDLSGTERIHNQTPSQSLIKLQNNILKEVGVTVSVGLSCNKFLAKTASDLDKPNGFAVLGRAEALDFLADKPVGFIYGVGPAFARSLAKEGLNIISDVRRWPDSKMAARFGDMGLHLARLSRAEDNRPVKRVRKRKSVSSETTFNKDILDLETLKNKLWQVCQKTADRSKAKNLAGTVVTLKLKTKSFETLTRRRTLPQPIQLADVMFRTCEPLLEKEANGRAFRLIGVGLSGLTAPIGDSGDLLDPAAIKRGLAERASDKAREKFGKNAVMTGRGFKSAKFRENQAYSLPEKIKPDSID